MIKESVKNRIIAAASELFYYEGYNQTGINKIIKEAQVSKDSMYRHFKSKEAVAVAYLENEYQNWMHGFINFVDIKASGVEKVVAIFEYLEYWLPNVDYRGCCLQNIITDIPKEQHSIRETVCCIKTKIHQFISDELKITFINDDAHVKEISNQLMVLLEGAIILSQIHKNIWPTIAAKKACLKILKP